MKNSKYIKVSVSDRLPEQNTWQYFSSKSKPNLFLEYYVENKKEMILNLTEYWLEEVPDYEDEMKEMLEEVYDYAKAWPLDGLPSQMEDKIEELLTKLKTES